MHSWLSRGLFGALLSVTMALPATVIGAKVPIWVSSAPINPDYYHGVGMAHKKDQATSTYRDLARHRALRNLSMQISTTVSSRFILNTTETTGMTEEEVKSEILTHTESCLEGYEFVDSYETRTEYWEFYRFSKADCRAAQERHRTRSIAAAAAFLGEARQAEKRRDMVSALRFHSQAISELQNYFGEKPPEFIQAHAALERILSGMRLTARRPEMPVVEGESLPEPISVTCISLIEGSAEPARHLPVQFAFSQTAGVQATQVIADGNGLATLQIGAATPRMNGATVTARIDIAKLLDADAFGTLFQGFLSRLTMPEATVSLRVFPASERDAFLWHQGFAGKRVAIYAGCAADGKTIQWNKMRDELAKILANAGASIIPGEATLAEAVAWSASTATPWTFDTGNHPDIVLVAAACGRINRREAPASPSGQDCQFSGEIRTVVATGTKPVFMDRYQGTGGWNPMGEEMALDVLALHSCKRWQTAMLKHLGSK